MVPAPLTVRCCLRSSRGPASPLDWYEGGAGGCGSDASGVAGEGGPIMSHSRVRIGFAALTCSPDTDHSEEPMRPGWFRSRCSIALSLLVAMALGFVSSACSADPVPNPAVSGPIEGG